MGIVYADQNDLINLDCNVSFKQMLPSAGGRSVSLDNTFESEQREADKG